MEESDVDTDAFRASGYRGREEKKRERERKKREMNKTNTGGKVSLRVR